MRFAVAVLAAFALASQGFVRIGQDAHILLVRVTDLRSDRGMVRAALHNSEETFLGDSTKAFRAAVDRPSDGEANEILTWNRSPIQCR